MFKYRGCVRIVFGIIEYKFRPDTPVSELSRLPLPCSLVSSPLKYPYASNTIPNSLEPQVQRNRSRNNIMRRDTHFRTWYFRGPRLLRQLRCLKPRWTSLHTSNHLLHSTAEIKATLYRNFQKPRYRRNLTVSRIENHMKAWTDRRNDARLLLVPQRSSKLSL